VIQSFIQRPEQAAVTAAQKIEKKEGTHNVQKKSLDQSEKNEKDRFRDLIGHSNSHRT
jgi:hypothetical protein